MASIRQALATVLLLMAVARAQNGQIKHFMVNDANLIETQQGYAIAAPSLLANGWKTVSINGDQIQTIGSDCKVTVTNKQDFSKNQKSGAALDEARSFLKLAESNNRNQGNIYRSGVATYSLTGNMASVSYAYNMGSSTFQSNGLSMTKYNDQNMSIGKTTGLPNNLNRIFITGDVVTLVYNDGRVNMKPASCLQSDENQVVQQLKSDAQRAQANFNNNMNQFNNNMNQFNNNMNQFNHQMNQNMNQMSQNLNQNLNHAFNRNNFPFNFNPFQNNQNQQNQQNGFGFNFGFNGPQFFSQAANVVRNLPGMNLFGRAGGDQRHNGGLFSSFNFGG